MVGMTDSELKISGFRLLVQTFGEVAAERFIVLNNREPGDYTKWREGNLYVGETLHEVAERARAADGRYRARTGREVLS